MKKISLMIFTTLLLVMSASSVNAEKHPTKEEWLEVYLTHKIEQVTDTWQQRLAVNVAIVDKQIVVTLSHPYSEVGFTEEQASYCTERIKEIVESVVYNYEWAKNYLITVQYV